MANLNLNRTILGGKLTADPELKLTPNGVGVTSFTVAINRRGKDGKQEADFINCVAWRSTAEFICKYFRKGSSICVVGKLQTRSWTDNAGNKRYATDVVVDEAMFVDSKNEVAGAAATFAPPPDVSIPADVNTPPMPTNFEPLKDDDDLPF